MLNLLIALPLQLTEAAEAPTRYGGSTGPDLTRYFVVCTILVVATGLVAWGFRRLVSSNLKVRAAKRSLQTLDVLPLGGKRKVAVVRCYDRTFVLGLGDHEITPIAELDPVTTGDIPAVPPSKANDAEFAAALEAVSQAMPNKRVASTRAALPTPELDVVELSQPARKVVRRKVKKAAAKSAPKPAATPSAPRTREEALSVARAAQQLVLEKQRAREAQQAQCQAAQPKPSSAPQPAAAEPKQTPAPEASPRKPQLARLEGVLG
jgi:flagellar biogenesis protein FliO